MKTIKQSNEQGFSFFVALFAVALVLGVFIAWGIVANMNKETKTNLETVPDSFGAEIKEEQ